MSGAQPTVNLGDELPDIDTEILGFSPLGIGKEGDKKLKILPTPWPIDKLPPASATLLSVASKRGLLAAASPDQLIIASTHKVRKAFEEEAGAQGVVTNFSPDATLPVPQQRHVVFSADEDFLVLSAEQGGGLLVYGVEDLLKGKTEPGQKIPTDNTSIRALLPNPASEQAHFMAVVWDTGRLDVTDVAQGTVKTVHNSGVTCASWSLKGKAFVAGFEDGTATIHLVSSLNQVKGSVPRPPDLGEGYRVSAVNWLNNEELFLIYYPPDDDVSAETKYYFASTNKTYSNFTFRSLPYDPIFPNPNIERTPPPRFAIQRLRNWEPALDSMLVVTAAHSVDVGLITRSSEPIVTGSTVNEYQLTTVDDSRKAMVPMGLNEDGNSALIGEALDLSSTENAPQPSLRLEEVTESPNPLPAFFLLTHEGLLAAWWVVWDRSLEEKKPYGGLTYLTSSDAAKKAAPAAPTPQAQPPSSTFGNGPSKPAFGSPSAPGGNFGLGKPSPLGTGGPTFGNPGLPGKPSFGTPGLGGQPAFGKPSPFGTPSSMGAGSTLFGSGGSAPQTSAGSNPFAKALANNPKPEGGATGASPFGSFSGNKDGKSAFAGLGQQGTSAFGTFGQKPPPSSFGSTVTVDSNKPSGPGSTLPSFTNTSGNKSGSIFGSGAASSFPSFTSTQSGSSGTDIGNRGRDEATPTPQPPTSLFGGKFTLGSTFKPDGTAKDDLPKPKTSSGGSLFGTLGSALNDATSKPPTTPEKPEAQKGSLFPSTTPATAPRPPTSLFSGSQTPMAPPPQPIPEHAPLPPGWEPSKPSKAEEIPPLAGSPPVNIEAPSPSDEIPSSPLEDDEDGDLSNPEEGEEDDEDEFSEEEEDTGDDRSQQSSPTDGRTSRQSSRSFNLGNRAPDASQHFKRPPNNRNSQSTPLFSGTRREPLSSSAHQMPKPPTPQPVFSDLVDDEDERIRQELESEIEPSRTLPPFIARQEYTERALNKTGHAAQIEIVYRDINSMVDTLGLNSRSIEAFIQFHGQSHHDGPVDRAALEEVLDSLPDEKWLEKWSLGEIPDLVQLEDELYKEIEDARLKQVIPKLDATRDMRAEIAKLSSKINEERRRISLAKDPERLDALRKAALPKELADQQKALRKKYAELLTQLGKAEDALLLLRSKLASHNAKNGNMDGVPSVESIKSTIAKLMNITNSKNNEITLLESKLKAISLKNSTRSSSSPSKALSTPLRRSRGANFTLSESPYATPQSSRSKMSLRELNAVSMTPEQDRTPSKGYGLTYGNEPKEGEERDMEQLQNMVDDDLERLRESARRRRAIAGSLRTALAKRPGGVRKTAAV